MSVTRPGALSIAGFDPSGGAGILADAKTFEQHRVYGFGVCSAFTVQNDTDFRQVKWLDAREITDQLEPIVSKFELKACKIGIIQNPEVLLEVVQFLKKHQPGMRIVLDPVLKASAGFDFHNTLDRQKLKKVVREIDLLTPNFGEMQQLFGEVPPTDAAKTLTAYCPVLLKGGHNPENPGTDFLYQNDTVTAFQPTTQVVHPKHGSGCVLSAAIAANLALGYSLSVACRLGKHYTEAVLTSNETLLGYHFK